MRLMVVACLFLAQSAGPSLTFEVASIKPAPSDDSTWKAARAIRIRSTSDTRTHP